MVKVREEEIQKLKHELVELERVLTANSRMPSVAVSRKSKMSKCKAEPSELAVVQNTISKVHMLRELV